MASYQISPRKKKEIETSSRFPQNSNRFFSLSFSRTHPFMWRKNDGKTKKSSDFINPVFQFGKALVAAVRKIEITLNFLFFPHAPFFFLPSHWFWWGEEEKRENGCFGKLSTTNIFSAPTHSLHFPIFYPKYVVAKKRKKNQSATAVRQEALN